MVAWTQHFALLQTLMEGDLLWISVDLFDQESRSKKKENGSGFEPTPGSIFVVVDCLRVRVHLDGSFPSRRLASIAQKV